MRQENQEDVYEVTETGDSGPHLPDTDTCPPLFVFIDDVEDTVHHPLSSRRSSRTGTFEKSSTVIENRYRREGRF